MLTLSELKDFSRKNGFPSVACVCPDPVPEAEKFFEDWTAQGMHGGMEYLARYRERLERLKSRIPAAKSILIFAVNYYSGPVPPLPSGAGRIARYAWGRDYHRVIRERLSRVSDFISQNIPSANSLICVDTEPVFERTYAEKGGLGFRGKHTNLLSVEHGPWMFLAEIISDAEFETDRPMDHGSCGTCTTCIDLCPTGAILPEGKIDARRCIAYLTIEHKTPIPKPMRPLIKDWVFGCDECLNVCPFTRFSKGGAWPEFSAHAGTGANLDLKSLFEIRTNSEYERRFGDSPVSRASRKMLLRNAAVVLGNLKDASALPVLARALKEETGLVKTHAAWAIGQIGGGQAVAALQEALAAENDPEVLEEIKDALAGLGAYSRE